MEESVKEGVVVYVYGILEEDGKISYVGKSSSPKARMYNHIVSVDRRELKIKILDRFTDTENYWIKKLLGEGTTLYNRQVDPMEESWNIGDVISIAKRADRNILDRKTGKIFKSRNQYHTETGLSDYNIKAILENPLHKLSKEYLIEYIN